MKKFCRTPWRFQQTVQRPKPSELDGFVSTIFTAGHNIEAATVTIDEIVFGTERMSKICPPGSTLAHDSSISAPSAAQLRALLVAAFYDGPDFICTPQPKPFVFYADHHDWITFYANSKSHLNRVIDPLAAGGYKLVRNWQREL